MWLGEYATHLAYLTYVNNHTKTDPLVLYHSMQTQPPEHMLTSNVTVMKTIKEVKEKLYETAFFHFLFGLFIFLQFLS